MAKGMPVSLARRQKDFDESSFKNAGGYTRPGSNKK